MCVCVCVCVCIHPCAVPLLNKDVTYLLTYLLTTRVLKQNHQASESMLNVEKTQILMCGTVKDVTPRDSTLNFINDKIKLLGVWIGNRDVTGDNWTPLMRSYAVHCTSGKAET